ncbi:MAG TPA: hypothetical protein VJZ04_00020 [Lachnospiraceae bacterium]|jgi:hypothetical protein|nr:hypothetical protein [Lachnospiraceae bacterium]
MKTIKLILILTTALIIISCSNESKKNYSELEQRYNLLSEENESLKSRLNVMADSILVLKFSASDRLYQIEKLFSDNDFEKAKKQIVELKKVFPFSKEIQETDKLEVAIAKKEEEQRKEEERIKALGYKVFKDNTSGKIGNVSFVLSGFTFGTQYTFGNCSDVGEYSYRTADKDNRYFLASLLLSTKEKYASVPNFYLYKIEDGNLHKIGYFSDEYASWTSYGAKIGNYSDDSHDFSKVNTVKYKLACEISTGLTKQPLIMLVKKDGSNVKDKLTIDEVKADYLVAMIVNRNKL